MTNDQRAVILIAFIGLGLLLSLVWKTNFPDIVPIGAFGGGAL